MRLDAVSAEKRELERTPELEKVRARLFPDLSPDEGWKQIEAAIEGSRDTERWRRIEQLTEATMAADLAAQLPTQRTDSELAEKERVERADRFRLLFWRVETLIGAGYAPEQSAQLGRDLTIDVAEAVDLLRIGVPTNVGAPHGPGGRCFSDRGCLLPSCLAGRCGCGFCRRNPSPAYRSSRTLAAASAVLLAVEAMAAAVQLVAAGARWVGAWVAV